LFLDCMVLLQLFEGCLQLDVLLHSLVVVMLRCFLELLVELLLVGSHHEFLTVGPLHELLSDFGLILFPLIVLCLFTDDSSPLVNISTFIDRIIPFLLIVKLLNILLLLLNRFFYTISVKLQGVNLKQNSRIKR
jgi:hypothetical protein